MGSPRLILIIFDRLLERVGTQALQPQCKFWNAFDSIFLQHNSVIQDKLEQNPCQSGIGSADLNRTLATAVIFSIYHPYTSQFIVSRKFYG